MKAKTDKNIWQFKEDVFNNCQARVSSTFVEERTVCDIRTKAKQIRFTHEFLHIDDIKQIIREFERVLEDEQRRFRENEQNLNKEQENELEVSSSNS
jgi:hypothetical protein